jgi:hypothetical protein
MVADDGQKLINALFPHLSKVDKDVQQSLDVGTVNRQQCTKNRWTGAAPIATFRKRR